MKNTVQLKPVATEKAVMKIESENTITFQTSRDVPKDIIKKEVEELFKAKIDKVRTLVKNNKKIAYVKLKQDSPAIDVATKLGLI